MSWDWESLLGIRGAAWLGGITLIDYTGAERLIDSIGRLRSRGIDVALARLEADRAMAAAQRSGLLDALGADHVFHSAEEAVRSLGNTTGRKEPA